VNGLQVIKPSLSPGAFHQPSIILIISPSFIVNALNSPQVKMAFSLEEAPCGSTGFFTWFAFTPKRLDRAVYSSKRFAVLSLLEG